MRFVREKHGFKWYTDIAPKYHLVGISNDCPMFAIAAYKTDTGQWDCFWILKIELNYGFPEFMRQTQLGSFGAIGDAIAVINTAAAMIDQDKTEKEDKSEKVILMKRIKAVN